MTSLLAAAVLDAQPDDRRAEDVAGVEERRLDARRDLALLVVVDRAEVLERPLGVLDRVQRRVEVDLELRGLAAQLGLGVARRPVVAAARARWSSRRARRSTAGDAAVASAAPAGGSRPSRRRPPRSRRMRPGRSPPGRRPPASVVGRDLVGMALLPARLALGELLVEVARVEQDERRPARTCRRSRGSSAVALLHEERQRPQWSRWAWVSRTASSVAGSKRERDAVADRLVRAALEHAAVDEDAGAVGREQELRAGDGGGAAEEVDLHGSHGDRTDRQGQVAGARRASRGRCDLAGRRVRSGRARRPRSRRTAATGS